MKLHEMALEDEDGGEEEIRETLSSMGYNEALQLIRVKLFIFESETCLVFVIVFVVKFCLES